MTKNEFASHSAMRPILLAAVVIGAAQCATSHTSRPEAVDVELATGAHTTVFPRYGLSVAATVDALADALQRNDEAEVHEAALGAPLSQAVVAAVLHYVPKVAHDAAAALAGHLLLSPDPRGIVEAVSGAGRLDLLLLAFVYENHSAETFFLKELALCPDQTLAAALALPARFAHALMCAAAAMTQNRDAVLGLALAKISLSHRGDDLEAHVRAAMRAVSPRIAAMQYVLWRLGSSASLCLLVEMWTHETMLDAARAAVFDTLVAVAHGPPFPAPGTDLPRHVPRTALDLLHAEMRPATFVRVVAACLVPGADPHALSFDDDDRVPVLNTIREVGHRIQAGGVSPFHTDPELVLGRTSAPEAPLKRGGLNAKAFFGKSN